MTAKRWYALQLGTEFVPKSLSIPGGGPRVLTEPVFGVLVETSEGPILLDTGLGRRSLDNPDLLTAIYGADRHPTGPPGEPLAHALQEVDIAIEDIALAVISHLHLDHTGGIPALAAAGVPIAIQSAELAFGKEQAAAGTEVDVAFQREDYLGHDIDWRFLDGMETIAPGVTVLPTPGHTPGHQSFQVDLPGTGTWIFAADAADLAANLHESTRCGSCAAPGDEVRAADSTRRLIDRAADLDARLMPGHDPIVWRAAWHPPGGHR